MSGIVGIKRRSIRRNLGDSIGAVVPTKFDLMKLVTAFKEIKKAGGGLDIHFWDEHKEKTCVEVTVMGQKGNEHLWMFYGDIYFYTKKHPKTTIIPFEEFLAFIEAVALRQSL